MQKGKDLSINVDTEVSIVAEIQVQQKHRRSGQVPGSSSASNTGMTLEDFKAQMKNDMLTSA